MKSIIRKPKSQKEKEQDFYQTNPLMVQALVDWLKEGNIYIKHSFFSKNTRVLDPCCGNGVIQKGLSEIFHSIVGFDKFVGDINTDFFEHCKKHDFFAKKYGKLLNNYNIADLFKSKKQYDLIVMNPPYSNKYKFILHSIEISKTVIALLPLNISNYNMFHRQYEDIPEFVGKIQMAPKVFLSKDTTFNAGGNTQYCWYIWDCSNNTNFSKTWYADLRKYQQK